VLNLFLTPRRLVVALASGWSLLVIATAALAGATGVPRIAFSSMRAGGDFHLYLINANGANVTRVTQGSYGGDGAVIAPEGSRIVFESPRYGYGQLFVVNTDGGNEHRVLSFNFYGQSGTWSPDGNRIAFSHSSNNGNPGGKGTTWVVNTDGSGLHLLSPLDADDWLPDWSPDGTRIAFCSFNANHGEIWVMNADGTGRVPLTSGTADRNGPRWSPDGAKIAYTLFPIPGDYSGASIHVMDAAGGGDVALTDTSSLNARPAWSPDGSQIAFHSNRSGCFQLYTMKADGSAVQRITWVTSSPGDFCGSWKVVQATPTGVGDRKSVV
jgi:Tol biopolymer transport system component